MDFVKNVGVIGLLLLCFAVPSLAMSLDELYVNEGGEYIGLNFASNDFLTFGGDLLDGDTRTLSFMGTGKLETYTAVLQIISLYAPPGEADVYLTRTCLGENQSIVNLTTVFYGQQYWLTKGYTFMQVGLFPSNDPALDGIFDNTSVTWFNTCNLTIHGDDVKILAYVIPTTHSTSSFPTPNPDLAEFVGTNSTSGVRGIVNTGFDIVGIQLIIVGVLILAFLLIYTAKLFEWFAEHIKIRNE